jgi:hypothetical protein
MGWCWGVALETANKNMVGTAAHCRYNAQLAADGSDGLPVKAYFLTQVDRAQGNRGSGR